MTKQKFNPQSGKSLVEILVVVAITSVVVTFAVARFGKASEFFQRQNIVRAFKTGLERARFDSVKRRASGAIENLSRVTIDSATSFTVRTDLDQNGTLEANETRLINFSNQSGVKFVGIQTADYPITIAFDRHGHIFARNGSGTLINPLFTLCDEDCTIETANSKNSNVISISPSGTVALMRGGETMPTFNNPSVTNVNASENINDYVRIDETSALPTGEPTPVPTTTPTPSPTPSPTAEPENSPTPSTPTPTPSKPACAKNQVPAQDNCECKLPMTVRPNNKCM